jgi:lactate permease
MEWTQNYDPFHNAFLSTAVAALPVVVLLTSIALLGIRIHIAALAGLAVALGVAIAGFGMPIKMAGISAIFGAAYGLFPIGWIILNLIFLYQLTVDKGHFDTLRASLANLAPDPRVQVILVAFAFGAFFEGAAGFGTPVAVTGAILIQLGFKPLEACGLSLIANTAPVAFGAMGTPVIALAGVTGIPDTQLSAMVGRQLPFFSLLVPFWVVCAFSGIRGMLGVWPVALTAGLAFAIPQFLVANFNGPSLVDVVASLCSLGATALLLKVWKPKEIWPMQGAPAPSKVSFAKGQVAVAWLPWIILSLWVFAWGEPHIKKALNDHTSVNIAVVGLDKLTFRAPPVAIEKKAEAAVFALNWLTATGTAILLSAIVSGFLMGYNLPQMIRAYARTIYRVRFSLITIAAMLALGYVTKYSGADATLGLALAHTGALYPFFGTLLGWLGVALTGSDTASNVLFGSLQKITAQQTGLSPILMAAANSSGGVMGKMVDAQSIVVASTATNWYGHEGTILRYVFWHSLALASLVGILVFFQAYVAPFTQMVVK